MPTISILTFIASFFFIILVSLYIYLTFYNNRTKKITNRFLEHANKLNPIVFRNIKIRYWSKSGLKTYAYPNNYCDIYLLDDSLAIIRRQNFILEVFFRPILLTSDTTATKISFNYLDTYKPDTIFFKQTVKGEVDIKLTDLEHNHFKIYITFMGLTNEQLGQLEKIKNWS